MRVRTLNGPDISTKSFNKPFMLAGDAPKRKEYTVPYALNLWIEKGFPAHKIALGLATYGRSFRLKDASNHGLAAPKADWGNPPRGRYTREPGLSYF